MEVSATSAAPSLPPATATTGAALNYMFCVSGGLGGPALGCRGAAALLFITRITLRPAHQLPRPRPRHHTRRYEVINLDKCARPAPYLTTPALSRTASGKYFIRQ